MTSPDDYSVASVLLLSASRHLSPTNEFWLRDASRMFVGLMPCADGGTVPYEIGDLLTWPNDTKGDTRCTGY